jgi:hypothetical protein
MYTQPINIIRNKKKPTHYLNGLPRQFSILTDENPCFKSHIDKKLADILDEHKIPFQRVIGSYKGNIEQAYLVDNSDLSQNSAEILGCYFGQESVIHHENGINVLTYVNGPKANQWENWQRPGNKRARA